MSVEFENFHGFGLDRYVCDVLEEMRKCHETHNYAPLLGLIEETQSMVNRMEAALSAKDSIQRWEEEKQEKKKYYKELKAKVKELEKKKKKLEEEMK